MTIAKQNIRFQNENFSIGTRFTVQKVYGKKTFTVTSIDEDNFDGAGVTGDAGDGIKYWFPFESLDYYFSIKYLKVIAPEPTEAEIENQKLEDKGYDVAKLIEAKTQLVGFFVTFKNEDAGSKWFNAVEKAHTELIENDSIKFDGQKLTFISRDSKKRRTVTRFGCHESCICQGTITYHLALFELLHRYRKVVNNVRHFPVRENQPMRRAA